MTNDINLLAKKNRYSTQAQAVIKVLKRIAVALLCIDVALVITVFVTKNDKLLADILNEQQNITGNLSYLQVKTVKILLLDQRLVEIQSIMHNRPSYNTLLDFIRSQLPESITIETFAVDKKGMDINVSSVSLVDIGSLIDALSTNVGAKKIFKQFIIEGLAEDKTGKFTLSLHAVI